METNLQTSDANFHDFELVPHYNVTETAYYCCAALFVQPKQFLSFFTGMLFAEVSSFL